MHNFFDDEDEDAKPETHDPETGDYALDDSIGERVGKSEDHNPGTLGDE